MYVCVHSLMCGCFMCGFCKVCVSVRVCWFFNVFVCVCGFFKLRVCVHVGCFVMYWCVHVCVAFLKCFCVYV